MTNHHDWKQYALQAVVLAAVTALAFGMIVAAMPHRMPADPHTWVVRPLAIAHRGDDTAPENSLRSIANAARNGADYAEIDVRLTADGTPVVFHDRRTGRLSLRGRDVPVSSLTVRQLQRMVMSQHGERYRVPTLAQVIDVAQRTSSDMDLLLDLKTNVRHARRLTDAVAAQIERYGFADRVMMMSTNDEIVTMIRRRHPDWIVGKCVSPAGRTAVEWTRDADFVVMRGDRVTREIVDHAHRDNLSVYAGVGGDARQANRCLGLGVDGVLSDSAGIALRAAERHETRLARG
ncbi:glycerophosphodiester phosphodiesterase [Bifidobacterium ramosum]|uniref:Glycerophosphodiester phosphodiesterase n=1 Tax=Bifidobacterium ramosum TaxID=1798158 RepID=A0A6L4WZ03_9BIFI|nr:glycerophosphodiester phosphodiesterase family protein [Bifidobacterium ramosum]KAB8286924.1 glycerophosphodiester phosphodiesterase [Bifidobacterium ramosum]NEG72553.1 hypothetical protein [Bifidobacterium ramosum]